MFENQEKGFVIDLVDCVTANCLTLSFVQCPHSLVSGKVLSSAHMTSTSAFDSFDPILILSHHNSSLSSSFLLLHSNSNLIFLLAQSSSGTFHQFNY